MEPRVLTTEIFIPVEEVDGGPGLVERVTGQLGVQPADVAAVNVVRRSLDARKGRPIGWRLVVEVDLGKARPAREPRKKPPRSLEGERVVIAGSGPAGT